jgi:hypothetical protein
VIGEADTKDPRPVAPRWVDSYAKGVQGGVDISTRVTGLSYLYDDFNTLNAWIPVHGRLQVSGGNTSDVLVNGLTYGAAVHKTVLLTDNCRAKVKINDGILFGGESRLVICSDARMNRYYGVAIQYTIFGSQVAIIRGTSSIAADRYATTTVSISVGDEFEVWYDRMNSTVRVYKNGSEVCSQYFPPADIPHGPGNRYVGIVMAAVWYLGIGPKFDSLEAWDEDDPAPTVYDPIDSLTVHPKWTPKYNGVRVNQHLFQPNSLGPNRTQFDTAAVLWADPMQTNSVKVVTTVLRWFTGEFTLVVRSNAAMTNWVGVRFIQELNDNRIQPVIGTGVLYENILAKGSVPHTLKEIIESTRIVTSGDTYTVTYNDATNTIKVYKGANTAPILSYYFDYEFTGTGKYVGMIWNTSLLSSAIEPIAYEAYDVTPTQPLPG